MDKSWISKLHTTPEYEIGLDIFLYFAFKKVAVGDTIRCPCPMCRFLKPQTRSVVRDHLLCKPFPKNYVVWTLHGERKLPESSRNEYFVQDKFQSDNMMETMLNDAFDNYRQDAANLNETDMIALEDILNEGTGVDSGDFREFLNDGSQILQEGSNYTKLEFIVKLYHIKVLCGLSDKAITMILDLLRDAFQQLNLPHSFYEAKKTINKLGLDYTKIDACPNDCILFLGDDEKELQARKHCGASRWNPKKKKKQAAKVLRYFPLKTRLQRLFMCSKTAEHMRWHALDNNTNGLLRHPKDGEAWKNFNLIHPEFASDHRNVRLGLASDGFNPFGTMNSKYSVWPVFLIPYNIPPWMCVKHTSFILSMIIPGKSSPGNSIDVYLQPLVNELKELWNDGVVTFDVSMNESFRMRETLMWTISDFPALGNLSGWNTHTSLACPNCNFDSKGCRLSKSKKWCFMGHRRFLSRNHRFRLNRVRFNGDIEERNPPSKISGSDILRQTKDLNFTFGRGEMLDGNKKRPRKKVQQWNKRSIFFELPYWEFNLLRHNLDFMHIEKNVCDNVLYTFLNDMNKSKDNLNARKDLQEMGIRLDLWPNEKGDIILLCFH
ncbi:uncharacterized protein LOC131597620 [Vicia villosa]|uniref:uncharacterized protein LOC131597620 n=1 Tax=Vicia villosa TaxID=3911 RepID=UPI00273AC172|nr:uncharacterized protein LOC131597620 [Vicia villosa]